MADHYKEWRLHFNEMVEDMFTWEDTREPLSKCMQCHLEDAHYRCTECWDSTPHCYKCHIAAQRNQWFHWVEAWNGDFWERYDLMSIGLTIRLGHNGEQCPNRGSWLEPSRITVVHTNGIHNCQFEYCHCRDAPP